MSTNLVTQKKKKLTVDDKSSPIHLSIDTRIYDFA
jgi:hypothetical protein